MKCLALIRAEGPQLFNLNSFGSVDHTIDPILSQTDFICFVLGVGRYKVVPQFGIAKLVNITSMSPWFMVDISILFYTYYWFVNQPTSGGLLDCRLRIVAANLQTAFLFSARGWSKATFGTGLRLSAATERASGLDHFPHH